MIRLREQHWEEAVEVPIERFVFVDEAGSNVAMSPLYGRSPKGERLHAAVPHNKGKNITMIGALGFMGLVAMMSIEGAVNGEVFRTFVEQVLAPQLSPGDVVVMDNLRAHKVDGIQQAIEATGARVLYLPPYSPDYNPIESCWSKIKHMLRKAEVRSREAIDHVLKQAFDFVTSEDVWGWLHRAGYLWDF